MPKYLVLLGPVATDEIFQTGDTIELTEADAQSLIEIKVIKLAPQPEPELTPDPESEDKAEKPKPSKSHPKPEA